MTGSFKSLQWPYLIRTNLRMINRQIKLWDTHPFRMIVVRKAPTPPPLHTTVWVYLDQYFRNVTDSQSLARSVLSCLFTATSYLLHRPWTFRSQTSASISLKANQRYHKTNQQTTFVTKKRIIKKMAWKSLDYLNRRLEEIPFYLASIQVEVRAPSNPC